MTLTVDELNQRSLEVFSRLVDAYIETGEPVGSRTLSKKLTLSPATIRNVMADLEEAGLLYAPHTSAGRLPTAEGLKLFTHGLLEVGDVTPQERALLQDQCKAKGKDISFVLEQATAAISGLSHCAGLVLAPKTESTLSHVEFVKLSHERVLVVLITEDGLVENRLIEVPTGITPHMLRQASSYLSLRISGKTLEQARQFLNDEKLSHQENLDILTRKVIQEGLAVWSEGKAGSSLIVKGQANLLGQVTAVEDLERIKELFGVLETKETLTNLLDASIHGQGVQIFIGAQNALFDLSGCSMIVAPYKNSKQQVLGAIGVVGPARMNYGKIIPLVDYTSKLVSQLIG